MNDEGREEKPYFKLSKNEHGTMWLLYRPSNEGEGRYNCWEPINEKFWTEFESLLNDREQLAKERELRKELVEMLIQADKLLQEEGYPALSEVQSLIQKAKGT